MTYKQIINEIKSEKRKPVYVLTGDEPYFIDRITNFVADNLLSEEDNKEFNQTILYGKDSNIRQVIEFSKQFPMMAPQRVVIVKEAQLIDSLNDLEYYIENPQPQTLLLIAYKYKKVDKRLKIYKKLKAADSIFEFKKFYDNEVPGWIIDYLKERKVSIPPKAAALLFEHTGNDLTRLTNEMDKLISLLKEEKQITPQLIEKYIGISKDYNVFELQDALINKNAAKAFGITKYFAENIKSHPLPVIFGSLFSFYSKLLCFYYKGNNTEQELASKLRINRYFLNDYQKAKTKYSAKKVYDIVGLIRTYDAKSKGIGAYGTDADLLNELVIKILT